MSRNASRLDHDAFAEVSGSGIVGTLPSFAILLTFYRPYIGPFPRNGEQLADELWPHSWWTFRIFLIFFCSGARKRGEESEEVAGAPVFFIKSRGRGRFPTTRRGRGKGAGGMSVGRGGGPKYFFSGPKCPPSIGERT